MKNTSGVSLAAGGSTPNERFQIANIISFIQSRIFDPPCLFEAGNEGVIWTSHVMSLHFVAENTAAIFRVIREIRCFIS